MAQDNNTQRWVMYSIIGFNVTVILFMIIYSFKRVGGMAGLFWTDFATTLILACIVAGGVFWISKKLNI
jgi:hypothetical protein